MQGELWVSVVRIWEKIDRVITSPHCANPVYLRDPYNKVSVDRVAPGGARPSAGIMLATKQHDFFLIPVCIQFQINVFAYYMNH